MSLLHKALKKAEREGEVPTSPGVMVDTDEAKSPSLRVYVLIGLAVAALMVTVLLRFGRKPGTASAPGKEFATPVGLAGQASAGKLSQEGAQKMESGEFEEARGRFEKLTILEPRNAEAYNNLGLALKKLGRNEEAFEQYRKALSIDPACASCLNNLGVLYMANRDLAEAESHFQKAVEAKAEYADPYFHMALLQEARGDLAGAKKNYLKFVELARGIDADFLLKIQKRIAALQTP